MDKQQARDIVRDTLGEPFDKIAFTRLARELFNQFDETKAGELGTRLYEELTGIQFGKIEDKHHWMTYVD